MNCVFRGQHIKGLQSGRFALIRLSAVSLDSYVETAKSVSEGSLYARPQGTEMEVAMIQVHKFIRVEVS